MNKEELIKKKKEFDDVWDKYYKYIKHNKYILIDDKLYFITKDDKYNFMASSFNIDELQQSTHYLSINELIKGQVLTKNESEFKILDIIKKSTESLNRYIRRIYNGDI